MNILQIAPKVPYPPIDGSAVAISSMSVAFSEYGHSVHILAINTPKHYSEEKSIKFSNGEIPIQKVFVNTNIKFFRALFNLFFSRMPYNFKRFYSQAFKEELIILLKKKHFDVIQIEGVFMMQYISVIREYSKALVSLRSHNIENEIWFRNAKNEKNFFKRIYLKSLAKRVLRFEKSVINKYDAIVSITERDMDQINKMGNTQASYIAPFGINYSKCLPYQNTTSPLSLFFIGALDWIPNQEGLLWFLENVWTEIKRSHKDLQCNIAGRNAPDWLIKKIDFFNANYKGEVDDAFTFIASNAIMLVPLFAGSGMRVKIIEGMALKKAIITTNIGAEGINVEDNKHVMFANNKEEFINKLNNLINNKTLIKEIGAAANAFVTKKFDNFVICDGLLKFYRESQT